MKLYHGTTEAIARQALEEGLLPREESGHEGNWDDCPSREDMVYLTRAYAPYFALCAGEPGEKWGLVEIDTSLLEEFEDYLHPDEDFLEQATRGHGPCPAGLSMEDRTTWFRERLLGFQHIWEDSITGLGNAACLGGVPAECVSKVVIFDPETNPVMGMMASDPQITLMNYRILGGSKYRALTDWFFGYETPIEAFDPTYAMVTAGLVDHEFLVRRAEALQAAIADRSGIETLEAIPL